jgi:hypothetical protein
VGFVALIFGGVLTAGTGGPGVVFLIFIFLIGMLNEWGVDADEEKERRDGKPKTLTRQQFSPRLKAKVGR